jgi:polysaccharide export outer membrane protein
MQLEYRSMARLLAAALTLWVAGCSRPLPPPPPEEPVGERLPYVIGVTDVLRVTVWKSPELGVQVVVRPDGKISVPLVDDVQAEGLTPLELKEVITEKLSEYIAAPDVTVVVMQLNSNTIAIMGGVRGPRVMPLQREMRVLEAITAAGGFSPFAKKNQVRILRRTPRGIVEHRFDYGAYLAGKAPNANLVLKAGDTIVVPD